MLNNLNLISLLNHEELFIESAIGKSISATGNGSTSAGNARHLALLRLCSWARNLPLWVSFN